MNSLQLSSCLYNSTSWFYHHPYFLIAVLSLRPAKWYQYFKTATYEWWTNQQYQTISLSKFCRSGCAHLMKRQVPFYLSFFLFFFCTSLHFRASYCNTLYGFYSVIWLCYCAIECIDLSRTELSWTDLMSPWSLKLRMNSSFDFVTPQWWKWTEPQFYEYMRCHLVHQVHLTSYVDCSMVAGFAINPSTTEQKTHQQ